jgi:hypothetical protein
MINVLVGVAKQTKAQAGARVAAASAVLDRGWGKAPATLSGPDGGAINVIIRQILDIAEETEPKLIEQNDKPPDLDI